MHKVLHTTHFLREAVARAEAYLETSPSSPAPLGQLLDAARIAVSMLDHVVMTAVDLVVTCNAEGIITFVSDTSERLLGYTPAEATGQNMVNFVHPEDSVPLLSALSSVTAGGSAQRIQARHFHRDGSLVWLEWRGSILPGGQGLTAFARNVTPYKQYERLMRESEMLFHALFELSPDAVYSLDREGQFVTTNPACTKITGYSRESLVGQNFATIVLPESIPYLQRLFEAAIAGETQETEAFVKHKDGHTVALHVTAVPLVLDEEVAGIYGVARDITERKQSEARLAHLAYHDPLTGLANRTLFMTRLEQAMAQNTTNQPSLAVLYLDLDDFKIVNDSLGHRAGDMLLVEAAERLRACVGAQATVARLGGDEFTVLLEGTADTDDAIWVTLKVLHELKAPYMVDGHKVVVTPSVGVVMGNQGRDAKEVLRYADIAMYRAKQNGKARYEAFSPVMYDQVMQRLKLETDLRLGLEREEFRLWFQPVVDLKSGEFVTVEALVRWEHPERGMVSPAEFIPLAEETGLILTLGSWVLEEACRQARAWQELHKGLVVSVNLSARQFQEPFLADAVGAVLERAGLDPHLLQLEITETVLMTDGATTQDTLRDLKQLGMQLAMDDFGTGYSSLSYLKRFPIDVLKIDRSFVSGLGESPEDTTLVETVIMLAKALGLSVTAEGVETEDQAERLRAMGCDYAQGYLFARPLPAAKLKALLKSRQ